MIPFCLLTVWYQDVYAPLVEAVLNLGLSILLGYYYGLTGILFGVAISLLIVVVGWKPYFLYRYGFKCSIGEYIMKQFKYVVLILGTFVLFDCLRQYMSDKLLLGLDKIWWVYHVDVFSAEFGIILCR